MESGYPSEWFVEPVDEYLKCGICSKVLRSPRATACGHVFCKHCIISWIDYYGICPNRCDELDVHQLSKALHIEKRVAGLIVRCKYRRSGCGVHIPLAEKHHHEKGCPYRGLGDMRKAISLEDSEYNSIWSLKSLRGIRAKHSGSRRPSLASNRSAPAIMTPAMVSLLR